MTLEELYKLKIAALLHDPPLKPCRLEEHEARAEGLARELFGDEVAQLIRDRRVRLADSVAASFDRWILSILMGGGWIPGLFRCEVVKIKNILAPTLSEDVPCDIDPEVYRSYVEKLKSALSDVDEWRLRYHLFYLLYEALWIHHRMPWGPADTRVPTHSVFDHDYATAAVVNWTYGGAGRVRGLLVGLDVAGTQEFVASSRKVRDAWISSYLVSALAWYAVVELVDKLGPDVLIMPSPRMNIFYLFWLESTLNRSLEEARRLSYLSPEALSMLEELGVPPYPVVPGRATLVLPPEEELRSLLGLGERGLREYFVKRFERGWRLLWRTAEELARRRAQGERKELVWSFIKRAFEYYSERLKGSGFDEHSPLGLRVECVHVDASGDDENLWRLYDEKYRELVARLGLAKYSREEPETKLGLYDLTKGAFEGGGLGFPKPSSRGFDYCTSCGKLPAMLILPSKESGEPEEDEYGLLLYCALEKGWSPGECSRRLSEREERERLVGEYREWRSKGRVQLESLKSLFSPGERLCPWCFLKRVLSLEPRLLKILLAGGDESSIERVVSEIVSAKEVRTWFPSLAHIASTRLYEKIAGLDPDRFKELITERLRRLVELDKWTAALGSKATWTWHFMRTMYRKMIEKAEKAARGSERELAEVGIRVLTQSDPEYLWFDPDKRRDWGRVLGEYGLGKWCWRYYALVKADGDSVGDLLEGNLTAFLAGEAGWHAYNEALAGKGMGDADRGRLVEQLREYIVNSCEGPLREFMEWCLSAALEGACPDIDRYAEEIAREGRIGIHDARQRIDQVVKILRGIFAGAPRLVVSPSYHVAISAALMRAAMLDVAIISELDGVVVYSGGDDLLALVPVDRALHVVSCTRRSYAGAGGFEKEGVSLARGFLRMRNACLPLLPNVGRSYCIYVAHYHYPLSEVVSRSSQLLKEAKEGYAVEYFDESTARRRAEKDVLVVAYNPRAAGEECAVLSLTLRRSVAPSPDDLARIACLTTFARRVLELVDERFGGEEARLSHSFLYDIGGYSPTLAALIGKGEERPLEARDLAARLVKEVVRRNLRRGRRAEELGEALLGSFEWSSVPLLSLVRGGGRGVQGVPVIASAIIAARLIRSGMR